MNRPINRAVRVLRFGEDDGLAVMDVPMPQAGKGEVRVRVLASSLNYTDCLIRRHLYPQTSRLKPPFTLGYDVVGEIDQVGAGVEEFQIGERVADMTVVGSNTLYRTLKAKHLTAVPPNLDPAEAAALILSWTTAYQLLHRAAHVTTGQRLLVQGAAGAVGLALLRLGRMAGLETWGTGSAAQADLIRAEGATPIDYKREDFTKTLPGGFDIVVDGVGEAGYRRSLQALRPGGRLLAIGYSAAVAEGKRMLPILGSIARLYIQRWMPGKKHASFYSVNAMRARHPTWFKEDLAKLFQLLAAGDIQPKIAGKVSLEQVAEAHRQIEAGGLAGKLVLCP